MGHIIGDNTTSGFTGSAFNLTTPKQMEGGIHQVTLSQNQKLTEFGILWMATPSNGTTGTRSLQLGLYDLDTDTLISGTTTTISFDTAALVAGGTNVHVKSAGLSVDLSAHAGKRVGIGIAPPSAASGSGFVVGIRTLSGSSRNNHSAAQATLPSTFAVTSTTANSSWGVYAITETIATAKAISAVTPNILRAGSAGNTISFTGFTQPVTGIVFGGVAQSITSAGITNATFNSPALIPGSTIQNPTLPQMLVVSNSVPESAQIAHPSGLPAGMDSVICVGAPSNNQNKIGAWFALADDDLLIFPTEGEDPGAPGKWRFFLTQTGGFSAVTPGVRVCYHWRKSDGFLTQLNITVNEIYEIFSVEAVFFSAEIMRADFIASKPLSATLF